MPSGRGEGLVEFLLAQVGDNLRSVVRYDTDGYDVVYIREDVGDQYSEADLEAVVRDLGIDAFEKGHQEGLYVHGDLNCTVRCFDDAIEMNFVFDRGDGIAVSLDGETFATQQTFIGTCLDLVDVAPGA